MLQNLLESTDVVSKEGEGGLQHSDKLFRATYNMQRTAGDERHEAMGLVDIVGDLIEDYESEHHALETGTGLQALKFLMDQHGLKQSDLAEIGSQGVLSEILAGKRELNIRQVRALSKRFGVSAGTFV